MEVVLNDYSLDAQFDNIDDFVDSLVKNTLLVLRYFEESSNLLIKSYCTYDKKISHTVSVYQFLTSQQFMGFSEAQKLRSVLGKLVDEPYWNDNPKTVINAQYKCDKIGDFSGQEPNCFSESLERDKLILSFEHNEYKEESIPILKNKVAYNLYNLFDENSTIKNLFLLKQIGFVEFLVYSYRNYDVEFYANGSKYYADEYYDNGALSQHDVLHIKEDFDKMIKGRMRGNMLPRLLDSISYRNITYNEFRTSLTNNREFRIYFYMDGKKWVFFDSIIKTTESIPEYVKNKTYNLIRAYQSQKL